MHAVEKFGKTSLGAHFPSPIFIETLGETGLETLIDAGRLESTPHFPEVQTWDELLSAISAVIDGEHKYKTLVLDTLNGAERLCHEHVCQREFHGDWGERGFAGYQRGYEVSLADWRLLLSELDHLRSQRRMTVVCLCHSKIKTFSNPEGADYDRYRPDLHDKSWSLAHKWADVVLFGNFETFVDQKDAAKKGKGTSNQGRMLYTERHAAYDAGNRLGLSPEIDLGSTPDEAWVNFSAAVKQARTNGKAGE